MKKVPLLISAHSFITLWLLAHGGSPRSLATWHAHHGYFELIRPKPLTK